MKALIEFIEALHQPNQQVRLDLLKDCISRRGGRETIWVIHILSQRFPERIITRSQLKTWAAEAADIPPWLLDDSLESVGDLAEAAALVIPWTYTPHDKPLSYWVKYTMTMRGLPESARKERIFSAWKELQPSARILFNRLLCGSFRSRISPKDLSHALASISGIQTAIIAQRLARDWDPDTTSLDALLGSATMEDDVLHPYPFSFASPLQNSPGGLGHPGDWQVEWLWDGIRVQLIKQRSQVCLWSRTEELLTERFPELCACAALLADGIVLDGEIAVLDGKTILPSSLWFSRRGKRWASFRHARPIFIAHDILEQNGNDVRLLPLRERYALLTSLLNALPQNNIFRLSPPIPSQSWEDLARVKEGARDHGAKGIVLKSLASPYLSGRDHGGWWKWKASPLSITAVLLYTQRTRGYQVHPSMEFTFAVWGRGRLVPCVRTGEGLADEEISEIEAFVRGNTVERFGPVRTVRPALVFEISFDAIHPSARRKSGVVLTSPRILRWLRDKRPEDAETLERLHRLTPQSALGSP